MCLNCVGNQIVPVHFLKNLLDKSMFQYLRIIYVPQNLIRKIRVGGPTCSTNGIDWVIAIHKTFIYLMLRDDVTQYIIYVGAYFSALSLHSDTRKYTSHNAYTLIPMQHIQPSND